VVIPCSRSRGSAIIREAEGGDPGAQAERPGSRPAVLVGGAGDGDLTRRLERLPLDLALANQPEGQHRTGEAEQPAKGQHVVEAGEESLPRRVDRLPAAPGRDRGHSLVQAARRRRLDELPWVVARGEGSSRRQLAELVRSATDEDRPPDGD